MKHFRGIVGVGWRGIMLRRESLDFERLAGVGDDAAEKFGFVGDASHDLHVDENRQKRRAKLAVQNLIKNGGFAAAPFTEQDDEGGFLPIFQRARNEAKFVHPTKKHVPAANRIADDVRVGINRLKMPLSHATPFASIFYCCFKYKFFVKHSQALLFCCPCLTWIFLLYSFTTIDRRGIRRAQPLSG
ncbi:MAG: hypothetical protein ONB46_06485 [candidate division KSB1 bacterium]|nr:hypothetical protein [candidate division KSB1 bacterium]MDZ7365351.1 hypothetical protein [candidate division KSB1 bacterium]MDZ7407378.1 hypothetical protein [candidate division KSB1 bacterium]